jgi:hypothetical protein
MDNFFGAWLVEGRLHNAQFLQALKPESIETVKEAHAPPTPPPMSLQIKINKKNSWH